ncbi:uncharacterized protein [Rutidosis leptorrhynchoides]|uniref:uncharacterized protein isoform X2 n=1 Tax=Rutidosis leptorrhynchoides TaxID=125765 RepID=UPI003A996DA8
MYLISFPGLIAISLAENAEKKKTLSKSMKGEARCTNWFWVGRWLSATGILKKIMHLTDVPLPSSHQKELNGCKPLPIGSRNGSHDFHSMQVPTIGVEIRRAVNIIDENLNYTQQKVANLGQEKHHNKLLGTVIDELRFSSEAHPSSTNEAEDPHLDTVPYSHWT